MIIHLWFDVPPLDGSKTLKKKDVTAWPITETECFSSFYKKMLEYCFRTDFIYQVFYSYLRQLNVYWLTQLYNDILVLLSASKNISQGHKQLGLNSICIAPGVTDSVLEM